MPRKTHSKKTKVYPEKISYKNRTLIPLRASELEKHNIPFSANTFYFWHSQGKYREIFVKVAGKLFIDLDKFWELAEEGG
ncbi:hypothetical protein [Hippea maritima]|uniref:Uncharacterized protein n=1 Tax=Hippea maritima (strain ATCC 700847 / DSM 10411 / MH2) TaxID=760142 RepID=F2LV74_HIPMA|nr:hypothetical protein [Hippea maritima]AEA33658.1 hypothetical protein Hipma_0688 [Hippea maritima DSM 10411]